MDRRPGLVEVLGPRGCRFEHGTPLARHPRLEQDGSVTVGRTTWDLAVDGCPVEEVELRASAGGRCLGRFTLRPEPGAVPPPPADTSGRREPGRRGRRGA
ncbi:hypothetical protein OG873_21165 [Streptomyces violaceus]|uniref:Uncharacterized protein n=1 Tax=Streptomyces violaceus TaxID=1936 RepID=A0ABZ1NW12_STRVL